MKFALFKKHLQNNSCENVYLLEGEDAYFQDKALNMIIDKTVTIYPELNITKLSNLTLKDITESINVLPFLSEKRAVIIKEYYPNAKDVENLKNIFDNKDSKTVLIISNAKKHIQFKKITNLIEIIDCSKEDTAILKIWIKAILKGQNIEIENSAAENLAIYCGNDMMKIDNEIGKLKLLDKDLITETDIEQNVNKDTEYKAYMLANAVAQKNKDVYNILKDFISKEDSGHSLYLLSSLYNNYKRMFYIKDSKSSKEKLSNDLNIKPYAVTMAQKATQSYSKQELKNAMEMIAESEYNIKKGSFQGDTALYYMVAKLLN